MLECLLTTIPGAADVWYWLGPDAPLYWLAAQAVVIVPLLSWAWWRAFQWARGRRKVLGVWRTEAEVRACMRALKADAMSGRLLAYREKIALREYEHGKRFAVFRDQEYGA